MSMMSPNVARQMHIGYVLKGVRISSIWIQRGKVANHRANRRLLDNEACNGRTGQLNFRWSFVHVGDVNWDRRLNRPASGILNHHLQEKVFGGFKVKAV